MNEPNDIPEDIADHFYVCSKGCVRHVITSRRHSRGVGDIAGELETNRNKKYRRITFKGKRYRAHRVAWYLFYREQPPKMIDHIDNNGLNNNRDNLRATDHSLNFRNRNPKVLQKEFS